MPTEIQTIIERETLALEIRAQTRTKTSETTVAGKVDEQKLKSIYALFDADDTHFVLISDLELLFRALGVELKDQALETVSEKARAMAQTEGGHRIPYEQFVELFTEHSNSHDSGEEREDAFAMFAGEDGTLTEASIMQALKLTDARVSAEEVKEVLKFCDVDGDGKFSKADWDAVLDFVLKARL